MAQLYKQPMVYFTGEGQAGAGMPEDVARLARAAASLSEEDRRELSRFAGVSPGSADPARAGARYQTIDQDLNRVMNRIKASYLSPDHKWVLVVVVTWRGGVYHPHLCRSLHLTASRTVLIRLGGAANISSPTPTSARTVFGSHTRMVSGFNRVALTSLRVDSASF